LKTVPAILLDRDGTLIEDTHYPRDPSKIRWLDGVPQALHLFQKAGYRLFVVSNQSGVGRGIISFDEFQAVHDRFHELVREADVSIDEYHYCFDHPKLRSLFRKPATGMIPRCWKGHAIDWTRSVAIGDRMSDLGLGIAMGIPTSYLVRTGLGAKTEHEIAATARARVQVRTHLLEITKELSV
jgi:D-glycero-D-manno-heptose 1,7-bisphosphate phosphatase